MFSSSRVNLDENAASKKRVTVFDDRSGNASLAMTMYIESGQQPVNGNGEKWDCSSVSSINDIVRLKNVMKQSNQDLDSVIDIPNQAEGVRKHAEA